MGVGAAGTAFGFGVRYYLFKNMGQRVYAFLNQKNIQDTYKISALEFTGQLVVSSYQGENVVSEIPTISIVFAKDADEKEVNGLIQKVKKQFNLNDIRKLNVKFEIYKYKDSGNAEHIITYAPGLIWHQL